MTRGGKREGSGRPKGSTKDPSEITKKHQFRCTDKEYENYLKKGGAKWLRPLLREE